MASSSERTPTSTSSRWPTRWARFRKSSLGSEHEGTAAAGNMHRADSFRELAALGDPGRQFLEPDVESLRCPLEYVEGVTCRDVLAFHEDALGLPDDVAASERAVKRGFAATDVVAI